jgi:hypothetical protein
MMDLLGKKECYIICICTFKCKCYIYDYRVTAFSVVFNGDVIKGFPHGAATKLWKINRVRQKRE